MQKVGMEGSTPGATNAAHAAQDLAEHTTSRLAHLSDSAQQTVERLTQLASQAASRIGEKTHDLWEAQGPALDKARGYMREHPVATIAIAIAVGVVLSRLISRR